MSIIFDSSKLPRNATPGASLSPAYRHRRGWIRFMIIWIIRVMVIVPILHLIRSEFQVCIWVCWVELLTDWLTDGIWPAWLRSTPTGLRLVFREGGWLCEGIDCHFGKGRTACKGVENMLLCCKRICKGREVVDSRFAQIELDSSPS